MIIERDRLLRYLDTLTERTASDRRELQEVSDAVGRCNDDVKVAVVRFTDSLRGWGTEWRSIRRVYLQAAREDIGDMEGELNEYVRDLIAAHGNARTWEELRRTLPEGDRPAWL